MSSRRQQVSWTSNRDAKLKGLVEATQAQRPYLQPKNKKKAAWVAVAAGIVHLFQGEKAPDDRNVADRFKVMMKDYRAREARAAAASGVREVPLPTDETMHSICNEIDTTERAAQAQAAAHNSGRNNTARAVMLSKTQREALKRMANVQASPSTPSSSSSHTCSSSRTCSSSLCTCSPSSNQHMFSDTEEDEDEGDGDKGTEGVSSGEVSKFGEEECETTSEDLMAILNNDPFDYFNEYDETLEVTHSLLPELVQKEIDALPAQARIPTAGSKRPRAPHLDTSLTMGKRAKTTTNHDGDDDGLGAMVKSAVLLMAQQVKADAAAAANRTNQESNMMQMLLAMQQARDQKDQERADRELQLREREMELRERELALAERKYALSCK